MSQQLSETESGLLDSLEGRSLVIWGARMTGIGFLRFANKHDLQVVSFIDSDPALNGRCWNGIEIQLPSSLERIAKEHQDLTIVVAVSIKEDEIIRTLGEMGLDDVPWLSYSSYCETFFTIDIVGTCNLKCPSCARSMKGVKVPKGLMSSADFEDVVGKMMMESSLINHVSLYSWGEPFLHPQLPQFIDYLHSHEIAVAVSSNLSIRSDEQLKKVVRASPDYLKISLSGFFPETYQRTHVGGDINLVKSNLYKLRYFIDRFRTSIFVEVNYHLYKHNCDQDLERMRELCSDLGFAIAPVPALVMPVERVIDYCEGNPDAETTMLSDLLLVGIDEGLEATKHFRGDPCRFLTNQVNVNWDKSVPLCCICFSDDETIIAPDYTSTPLEEIEKRKNKHPLCKKCMKYGVPPYQLGLNEVLWKKMGNTTEVIAQRDTTGQHHDK